MKAKAKTKTLVNGYDWIKFKIMRKKHSAEITYYYKYGNSTEVVSCGIPDADERYEDAIANGYKSK